MYIVMVVAFLKMQSSATGCIMCIYLLCDAGETGDKRYSVKMFIDSTERSSDERILHAIQSLHRFMSIVV